ncbi:GntP family permease [Vibrio sp. CAIM 722]|uniref:GntP family permease n=1 Tax=Vibrio eleionomae TaxID=2653505 RepID=A0A7X4LN35_9VIBR|nr:GntP family permease [Vibrio eleionomae]MZI95023.1 GntP family permease [Vibrio eleionomae]
MNLAIIVIAQLTLIYLAYRGYSVILIAPLCALGAVLLTSPAAVGPAFFGIFMPKMVGFLSNYFPVFMLGAIFGKLMEVSGFAHTILSYFIRTFGTKYTMLMVITVSTLLTYGGVTVFIVVFAVYPFAAEAFRSAGIPKRLLPASIALGACTYAIDALPGSPQIQNIIPTTFYGTTVWAAPWMGLIGALMIFGGGFAYLNWRLRCAKRDGEGYGENHINEPDHSSQEKVSLGNPIIALIPLALVFVVNYVLSNSLPDLLPNSYVLQLSDSSSPVTVSLKKLSGIGSVMLALSSAILFTLAVSWSKIIPQLKENTSKAVSGAMLASMNTASEFGFGAVISALPGFAIATGALNSFESPLINTAITVNLLSGLTGSAVAGLSITLATLSDQFIQAAHQYGIPMDVMHRISSMASGGMDTLPHNGAIITLLLVCGLTHRQSYKDIFVITLIKTVTVFAIIGVYTLMNVQ